MSGVNFFGVLRDRLSQLSQRERLLAENIANASTPGYKPRDLDTSAFQRLLAQREGAGAMLRTNPMHMTAGGDSTPTIVTRPDSETTIDGNAVVLEEQSMRAAETRMAFETSITLYQKGLQLVRIAARPPR
jgi:flagellar basal-body rod protein FlgB